VVAGTSQPQTIKTQILVLLLNGKRLRISQEHPEAGEQEEVEELVPQIGENFPQPLLSLTKPQP
jgi:hypothetical protein